MTDERQADALPSARSSEYRFLPLMQTFSSFNPATGELLGIYPVTEGEEVCCRVEQARDAQREWKQWKLKERLAVVRRLRERLAYEADSLAAAITQEIGKPYQESLGAEVLPSVTALKWLERHVPRVLAPERVRGAMTRGGTLTHEPLGVIGIIGTWNYPLFLNLTPLVWALAAGNAVVWKPSELGTGVALRFQEILESVLRECHCPPGLVTLVTGDGTTGRALVQAGCAKIAFVGSMTTGQAILAELAKTATPSVMELSGNDPFFVFADADIELAARSAVWGRVSNAGQSCVAPQRFYVETAVYAEFLRAAERHLSVLRPGTGVEPGWEYGPLRTEALRGQVHRYVTEAVTQGATLVCGGHCLDRSGFFYAPTLLADCREEMAVMRESFFGPVLAVCPTHDILATIARMDEGGCALGASVWTDCREHFDRVQEYIRCGVLNGNDVLLSAGDAAIPFGGQGASGFGKMRGAAGLREFTSEKVNVWTKPGGARRHLFPYLAPTSALLGGVIRLLGGGGWQRFHALTDVIRAAQAWEKESRTNGERRLTTEKVKNSNHR